MNRTAILKRTLSIHKSLTGILLAKILASGLLISTIQSITWFVHVKLELKRQHGLRNFPYPATQVQNSATDSPHLPTTHSVTVQSYDSAEFYNWSSKLQPSQCPMVMWSWFGPLATGSHLQQLQQYPSHHLWPSLPASHKQSQRGSWQVTSHGHMTSHLTTCIGFAEWPQWNCRRKPVWSCDVSLNDIVTDTVAGPKCGWWGLPVFYNVKYNLSWFRVLEKRNKCRKSCKG